MNQRHNYWKTSLTLFLSVWACGCSKTEPPIAQLGKSVLTESELRNSLSYTSREDSLTKVALYLEDWLTTAALYEQAIRENIDKDSLATLLIEKSRRKIIAQRFVDKKAAEAARAGKFAVDSSEVMSYFGAHSREFTFDEPQFRIVRVYAPTQDAIFALRQRLVAGDPADAVLSEAARVQSIATLNLAQKKFAMGFFPIRHLQLESETLRGLLERMRPKDVSPIAKLNDSLFVVLRLEDRAEQGTTKNFEQAYPEMQERLRLQKEKEFFNILVRNAKSSAEAVK